jgi:hypothetical protein
MVQATMTTKQYGLQTILNSPDVYHMLQLLAKTRSI